ncbi:MAG: hypothetical protein JJU16_07545 [Alkalibacterium sp.]|nr:hypothetical protein [Alkalibacterium sp.]
MKRYMCPAMSIGFYLLYFMLLQVGVNSLPETRLTPLIVIVSVFIIIPVSASKSSARVMRKIKGVSCSM